MNKFISKIFRGAGVPAKVSKDSKNPRFKVVQDKLTLEGIVRPNRYSMTIKDNTGAQIDSLSVVVNNSNDIVNRINESIQTLKMLSSVYENEKLVEEDEEFDVVDVEDEEETEPTDIVQGLADAYNHVLDVAEDVQGLMELVPDEDPETLNDVLGLVSSLYDCAIDIDDMRIEMLPEDEQEEEVDESLSRTKKSTKNIKSVINSLTMCESVLRKNKDLKDILTAIKDVKAELIVRGY